MVNQPKKPETIVRQFEEAVEEFSWIGSKHPGDHAEITLNYHQKKQALYKLLGLAYEIPDVRGD